MRLSPSTTNDRSCRRPCQVAGVDSASVVGSVVKAKPASAIPARDRAKVAIKVNREGGRLRRSPEAKSVSMHPLTRKVSVMIQPYEPRASPLGQSKVGSFNGCQPNDKRKSYFRIVNVVSTIPKNSGPIIPARAASLIILPDTQRLMPANQATPGHKESSAAQ